MLYSTTQCARALDISEPTDSTTSYLDFYTKIYGKYLVEKRLLDGKDTLGMFVVQQPAGHFPDDATSTYNLQLNSGGPLLTHLDLGRGRQAIKVNRGDFVIAPPDTKTDYEVYNDHRLMCLGIPKSFFDNAAADLGLAGASIDALLSNAHQDPIIRQIVKECWAEANEPFRGALFVDANMMMLATRVLTIALGKGFKAETQTSTQPLSDADFNRCCEYADENLDGSLRMNALAMIAGMNEYRFNRAFKARTGQSPYQWVIDRRLTRAEALLARTDMSIVEVAATAGFSSQSHMTTLFSKKLGATPAEFRKAKRS